MYMRKEMNKFIIKDIIVDKNRIDYDYCIEGEWKKFFDPITKFWVEYRLDIVGIPKSLAAVPLVSNVIVLASIFEAKIYVPYLDLDFYNSIPEFMNGFSNMYPMIEFHYEDLIVCDNILDSKKYNLNSGENKFLLYFSGGVDAYTSLIRHENEDLILLTVCGADTWYSNKIGFSEIIKKNEEIARLHKLPIVSCISTLRKFINEKEIYDYIYPLVNDNFWHGFQHGLGMIGLSAGYVYLFNLEKLYFASSFCENDENYTCGSDPSIDNFVHIGSSKVYHDGFELSRQDKIISLCDYVQTRKKPIKLRVCYSSMVGDNCCKCEKCVRTMMGLLAEGVDPIEFGFDQYNPKSMYSDLIKGLIKLSEVPDIAYALYGPIIAKYMKRFSYEECPSEIRAFCNADFKDVLSMLDTIRVQQAVENHMNLNNYSNNSQSELFYKWYIKSDNKRYGNLCDYAYQYSELKAPQTKDEWIGNHGFVLNSNEHVEVQGEKLIIDLKRGNVVFEGWAADFINDTPLAEVFVKIDDDYYCLNYGLENKNLAKRFKNELFSNIAFRAELPTQAFNQMKDKTISFFMIGFKEEKVFRYPEINYIVSIKCP